MSASSPAPAPLLIITQEFSPQRGGIATFTEEIARAAAGLGHAVEVWAPARPDAPSAEPTWPFHLRRLPLSGSHGLRCQLMLAREFLRQRQRLRHATIYLPEPGPMLTLMWLRFWPGLRLPRLLLTFHGSEILKFHRNPITRVLARQLIRRALHVSTLTQFTRRLLLACFPAAAPKVVLTPGALRTGFAAAVEPPAEPRSRLVVLTVGRLHPRKGQWHTLRALQALPAAQRSQVEYWLVGPTARAGYERQLRNLAGQSDLVVRFLGDLSESELMAAYAKADIFALTSINHGRSVEGFGLVYLEASAHGLPVVGHAVGGVNEAVLDGQTGLLVSPEDPVELTAAFARLLQDAPLRRQLGQAGRAWARHHTWHAAAETLFGSTPPVSSS